MLCACDIYRPAAIDQLEVVGKIGGYAGVHHARDCRQPEKIAASSQ